MEKETKKCPYCGEEILAIAKKCKHCGEWLEDKQPEIKNMIACPVCAEQIEEGTSICPYCHESLIAQKQILDYKQPSQVNKIQTATSFLSHYFINVILKQYADFRGKATRKQYWLFVVFYQIVLYIPLCLDNLLGLNFQLAEENLGYGWLYILASLLLFVPSLAICIRRLHDIRKSGWWIMITLIPLVGFIWLIVLLCKKGESTNQTYSFTLSDKITTTIVTIIILLLTIFTFLLSSDRPHASKSYNWFLVGDTAEMDTLDEVGFIENKPNIKDDKDAEIKKQITHDYICYYAIQNFCMTMQRIIMNGHNGEGLSDGEPGDGEINENLILLSNDSYQWLLEQFSEQRFMQLLRAYSQNSDGVNPYAHLETGGITHSEMTLADIALNCLKMKTVPLNNQWFNLFDEHIIGELKIEKYKRIGSKTFRVIFEDDPNHIYTFDYSNGLKINAD